MSSLSIRSRFAYTFVVNIFRGGLLFATNIIIARSLGPESYGNLSFLLGTFVAVNQMLDLGTSNAFYTFMSQKPRGRMFLLYYAGWQFLQFILPLLVIGLVFTDSLINMIWLGHDRGLILLVFVAVFMQQAVWRTMIHIGESMRLTQRVQKINLAISISHLLLVLVAWWVFSLSVPVIFSLILVEYSIAVCVAFRVLSLDKFDCGSIDGRKLFHDYRVFCMPLVLLSLLGFAHEFADRWLLQNYGGPEEQAFYSTAYQFATASLLVSVSMMRIFWKEIAEAQEKEDLNRVHFLYTKVSRLLFMAVAVISSFLIPWSDEIVSLLLGADYMPVAPVLMVMLFYPLYQTLSHVNQTLFYASKRTHVFLVIGSLMMGVSIPMSYVVLASPDAVAPGFGLGALGIACKMVLMQVLGINLMSWWISRSYGWRFDWQYQVVGLGSCLFLGWSIKSILFQFDALVKFNLYLAGAVNLFVYGLCVVLMIWWIPWVAGLERSEIKSYINSLLYSLRRTE